jgi:hypothetical protein
MSEAKFGWMLFAADTPLIGLDPHPAYAPDPPERTGAEGWLEAYHVFETRDAAEAVAREDFAAALDAVEEGDLSDWADENDWVCKVRVDAQGRLEVFAGDGDATPFRVYMPHEVFGAFGMSWTPAPEGPDLSDQRGESLEP